MLDLIPTEVTNHTKACTDGVSSSERPSENPKIANRVPAGGQYRAPAMCSGPIRVSPRKP